MVAAKKAGHWSFKSSFGLVVWAVASGLFVHNLYKSKGADPSNLTGKTLVAFGGVLIAIGSVTADMVPAALAKD